jgi:hypothetical protein
VQGVAGSNPVVPTWVDKAAFLLPCPFLKSAETFSSAANKENTEFVLVITNTDYLY